MHQDPCTDPKLKAREQLDNIQQYAFDVWYRRPQPDTTYRTNYQRLKKWPEPSHLQMDYDCHHRNRPQPSFYFLHTKMPPLPSQRATAPSVPGRMPTIGGGIDGKAPSDCHMPSAARALSMLQWRSSNDDYATTAAIAADLVQIPHVNVRRTESLTHADMHKLNPRRGDFLIHPDWPPTIRHHRIPYLQH